MKIIFLNQIRYFKNNNLFINKLIKNYLYI